MHSTNRRQFLQASTAALSLTSLLTNQARGEPARVPQSVPELWQDFDPRRDPIETEVIREWKEEGGVYRHVRFLIGTFKGRPARMAAIYGYPVGARALPAVMHIHGGGQRGSLQEVKLLVEHGYAALSVNWGGSPTGKPPFNTVEGAEPNDPNTDWGAVDPSQCNVAGYNSLLPGPQQFFEDQEHPKNNNWYLLTLGCRRGLTFLEQQPEVDPQRLGVHGYSMGGNLTMYVIGSDDRVKAAVPAVGGSGWLWEEHAFVDGIAPPPMHIQGDVEVFRKTLSFESYAPHIRCPVLHRSGTNDFHGWMDDVYRTNALIPDQPTRYSWSPHFNHRLIPEVAVTMPLWFNQYLKAGPALPETPNSELRLSTDDHVARLLVKPVEHPWPVSRCEIYYSVDDDPRGRFWRSADHVRDGNDFVAPLPIHTIDLPMFAFANVYYTLPEPVDMKRAGGMDQLVREVCLSTLLHSVKSSELRQQGVRADLKPTAVIDDFAHGFRDWYQLNANNHTHREVWTRKLTDPLYRGGDSAKLRLTLTVPKTNRLHFVLIENEYRSYRGTKRVFVCTRDIVGQEERSPLSYRLRTLRAPTVHPLRGPRWINSVSVLTTQRLGQKTSR